MPAQNVGSPGLGGVPREVRLAIDVGLRGDGLLRKGIMSTDVPCRVLKRGADLGHRHLDTGVRRCASRFVGDQSSTRNHEAAVQRSAQAAQSMAAEKDSQQDVCQSHELLDGRGTDVQFQRKDGVVDMRVYERHEQGSTTRDEVSPSLCNAIGRLKHAHEDRVDDRQ